MQRQASLTSLSGDLTKLTSLGDTIHVAVENGKRAVLNTLESSSENEILKAAAAYDDDLIVNGVTPALWFVNNNPAMGEVVYVYPNVGAKISYDMTSPQIQLHFEVGRRVNIESETQRLKASTYQDHYLEMLCPGQGQDIEDVLSSHGLKIEKLDTSSSYITELPLIAA